MRKTSFLVLILVMGALALAACDGGSEPAPASGGLERPDPPAEYAGKSNPKAGNAAAAEAGKATFVANCASCHGESGKGDGPAGGALNPAPQDLSALREGLSDAYLFWRISEGGILEPFRSAMPAWGNLLDEDQIWEIITFIRTLDG